MQEASALETKGELEAAMVLYREYKKHFGRLLAVAGIERVRKKHGPPYGVWTPREHQWVPEAMHTLMMTLLLVNERLHIFP